MELSEKGAVLDVDVTSMLGKDWKVDEAAESALALAAKRDVEKGRKATPPAKGEEEGRLTASWDLITARIAYPGEKA